MPKANGFPTFDETSQWLLDKEYENKTMSEPEELLIIDCNRRGVGYQIRVDMMGPIGGWFAEIDVGANDPRGPRLFTTRGEGRTAQEAIDQAADEMLKWLDEMQLLGVRPKLSSET
jgi:hypothetical protein